MVRTDLSELATYLANNRYTLKDLGIDGFVVPTKYLSFTQLVNIYTGNKDVYDHVIHCMRHADNKRIYDIYKKIFWGIFIKRVFSNRVIHVTDLRELKQNITN